VLHLVVTSAFFRRTTSTLTLTF